MAAFLVWRSAMDPSERTGLTRRDMPTRFVNALTPGHLPPSTRRTRAVIGLSNRRGHSQREAADATAVAMATPAVRAASSMGGRKSVLSDSRRDIVERSVTPLLSTQRYHTPHAYIAPLDGTSPARHHVGREVAPETDRQEAVLASATAAPRRGGIPAGLRSQLLASPDPLCVAADASSHSRVSASRLTSVDRSGGAVAAMSHFLQSVPGIDRPNAPNSPEPMLLASAPKPKLRQEVTDYHSTMRITQAPAGAGMYATAQARFDPSTRSVLGHSTAGNAAKVAMAQRRCVAQDRIRQHTQHLSQIAHSADERSIARDAANIVRRAALRQHAQATLELGAKSCKRDAAVPPAFLPMD